MSQPIINQTSCRADNLRYDIYPRLPRCIVKPANVTQLHVLGFRGSIQKWIRAGVKQLKSVKKLVVEMDCSWDMGTFATDDLDGNLGIPGLDLGVNADGNREWMWEIPKKEYKDKDNDSDDTGDDDGDDDAVLKWS
jgi:hypothetical protein